MNKYFLFLLGLDPLNLFFLYFLLYPLGLQIVKHLYVLFIVYVQNAIIPSFL